MISIDAIQDLSKQIAEAFHPERIILFGSYAAGTATADSDVDLLVVMPFEGHEAGQSLLIRRRLRIPFSTDVIVRSPQQLRERLAMNDWFLRDIVEKGRTLYAADHAGVDRQS
jgi:predicted nucleotidyltransferase